MSKMFFLCKAIIAPVFAFLAVTYFLSPRINKFPTNENP